MQPPNILFQDLSIMHIIQPNFIMNSRDGFKNLPEFHVIVCRREHLTEYPRSEGAQAYRVF